MEWGQILIGLTDHMHFCTMCTLTFAATCLARPLFLRGGSTFHDPEVEEFKSMVAASRQFETGYDQWEALGYYQYNYWGGPCPAADCRSVWPYPDPSR